MTFPIFRLQIPVVLNIISGKDRSPGNNAPGKPAKGNRMETENKPEIRQTDTPPPAPPACAPAPERAAALSVGDYIIMFIVFSLPLVNLIMALVWGFGSGVNPNKRNFAKAWLIMLLIAIILGILMGLIAGLAAKTLVPIFQELFAGF